MWKAPAACPQDCPQWEQCAEYDKPLPPRSSPLRTQAATALLKSALRWGESIVGAGPHLVLEDWESVMEDVMVDKTWRMRRVNRANWGGQVSVVGREHVQETGEARQPPWPDLTWPYWPPFLPPPSLHSPALPPHCSSGGLGSSVCPAGSYPWLTAYFSGLCSLVSEALPAHLPSSLYLLYFASGL